MGWWAPWAPPLDPPLILTEQLELGQQRIYYTCMTRRTRENSLLAGTQWAIPSGQDGSVLTARVANHSTGFASSCPLIEPAV